MHVVDPEKVGASEHAGDDAGDGGRVAVLRVWDAERLAEDGFSRDGQQNGASENSQRVQLAQNPQVVIFLLAEIKAGIEQNGLCPEARTGRLGDFRLKKPVERLHHVLV